MSEGRAVNSATVVKGFGRRDIEELFRFWSGKRGPQFPATEAEAREQLIDWMADSEVVESRVGELGRRMGAIFEFILAAEQSRQTVSQLSDAKELTYLSG